MTKKHLYRTIEFAGKTGGVLGGIGSVFADFLLPLAPIGLYLSFGSLALLLVCTGAWAVLPKRSESDAGESIWFAPFACSLLVISALTYGTYLFSVKYSGDNRNGFLASSVPGIEHIQLQTGILKNIYEVNVETLKEQKKSNILLNDQVEIQENIQASTNDISSNSKKIRDATYYSNSNLQQAMSQGDLQVLRDFLNKGISLDLVNRPLNQHGQPMIFYAITANYTNVHDVLEFLFRVEAINPGALYKVLPPAFPYLYRMFGDYQERNTELDLAKENNWTWSKLGEHLMTKYGYDISHAHELRAMYDSNSRSTNMKWIGNARNVYVSLYELAILAENKGAQDFLKRFEDETEDGYVEMRSGVRISIPFTYR